MIDARPTFFAIGMVLIVVGLMMLAPAFIDVELHDIDWEVFIATAFVSCGLGFAMVLAFSSARHRFDRRQGILFSSLTWVVVSLIGALPFVFGSPGLSVTDAVFESVSGLTTTGSTVIVGIDKLPPGILLWRAMLQWVGGIGLVVVALAILPFLHVGGMQMFQLESSDKGGKPTPRIRDLAGGIGVLYLILTLACAFCYDLAGMHSFDAVIHALTTVSTGGYSTTDYSIGYFDSYAVDWVAIVFMLLGSLPFALMVMALRRRSPLQVLKDGQVRTFLIFILLVSLVLSGMLIHGNDLAPVDALTLATFNVVSIVTTTGYALGDFNLWGLYAPVVFFFLIFFGGCAGSTAGGLKTFRFQVLWAAFQLQLAKLVHPHVTLRQVIGGRPLTRDVVTSVMVYFFFFMFSFTAFVVILAWLGLDFPTATSAAATALANVGPGIGEQIGPSGSFRDLPDAAKWVLDIAMLLGRLEFMTVIALVQPRLWFD